MKITRRADHNFLLFIKRTYSAQIHLLGALVFLISSGGLVPLAYSQGTGSGNAALTFCITGLTVFLVSSTYHFLHDGFQINSALEDLFENLDHCSIYLFIAGTYSPLILFSVAETWKTPLLAVVWSIAILGSLYTLFRKNLPKFLQSRFIYTGLFVSMGWLFFLRIQDIIGSLNWVQGIFFCSGGLFYSIGAGIYAFKWPQRLHPHFGYHEIWHICVLFGALSHLFLVSSFYL